MNKDYIKTFLVVLGLSWIIGAMWGLSAFFLWDVSRDTAYIIGFVAFMFFWNKFEGVT